MNNSALANKPVMIAAGGTGGHIVPALAVVDVLQQQGVSVVWVGTKNGLESHMVPAEGIELHWISVVGLRGKRILETLMAPLRLMQAVVESLRLLKAVQPRVVLGMGGFVAGPVGVAAWLLRKPLVLHEQNAVAGMTNRYLAKIATRVFAAIPGTFPASVNATTVGNPVRASMLSNLPATDRHTQSSGPVHVLVVGGSRGARVLNDTVPLALAEIKHPVVVHHQTGEADKRIVQTRYASEVGPHVTATVNAFITDMASAYEAADLVICRAGAMTVTELAARGLPSILVPYPHAVDDHQTRNARFLVDAGGALLMPQQDFTASSLAAQFERLIADRAILQRMADKARDTFKPDAAERVAEALMEVAH